MKIIEEGRISSFFGDELKMGSYLFRLFPLLVSLIFLQYSKNKKKIFIYIFYYSLIFRSCNFFKWRKNQFFII